MAYKDFVDKREELITRIFERIGSAISTSEDLIELSKTEYAVAERQGKQRAEVAKIRESIKDSFSKNEKEWRNDKKRLEALLSYYYPAKPEVQGVLQVWQSLDNSLSTYMKCAEQWLKDHPREDNVSNACSTERESLAEQIHQLGRAFNTNRAYIWEGWESPEKLKESLAK